MRTATPLRTWPSMTLFGPSATEEAISTPRFIGPGCITTAFFEASATIESFAPHLL